MPTLNDLLRRHGPRWPADVEWLHLLVGDWQLISDLSFADLVLWVPGRRRDGWLAVAHVRPTTGPTVFFDDLVGTASARGRRPLLDQACAERAHRAASATRSGATTCRSARRRSRRPRRPRRRGASTRHTNLRGVRTPSRLELTYLQTRRRPGPDDRAGTSRSPARRPGSGAARRGSATA